MQTQAVLTSLQEQGIEDVYIELLKEIYTNSSMTVHLHKESNKINIWRGVRQGDAISPKLFTTAFESIFWRLTWETKGLKIDAEYLSRLRFADDILVREYTTTATTNATGISWWKWQSASEDDRNRHTNICQQHSDRERWKLHLPGTEIQNQRQQPIQGDSKKNHGWMDSIRQAPWHRQR